MVAALAVLICSLLAVVSWIGWRYFLTPDRCERMAVAQPAGEFRRRQDAEVSSATQVRKAIRNSVWYIMPPLLLAGAVVAGVLAFAGRIDLDPLEALRFQRAGHIQAALSPERLVAPPALPPSLFIDPARPALESADRDWNRLDPAFMQTVLQVFARVEARGYKLALLEGYRSPERQNMLAGFGAHVTNARAFQSKHQFGLAADVAPMRDGKLVISERDPWAMAAYQALGEEAEAVGLVWGGRWSLKDYGHVEAAQSLSGLARK